MNPLDVADNSWEHLFPPFRAALEATLAEVAAATHEPWVMVEGYRSEARQLWLYGQGRTRPGRKVTWVTEPKWHGTGLAADVEPVHKGYAAPREWWEQLQAIGRRHGLHDPPWNMGDLGHLQLDTPEQGAIHQAAIAWVERGFPAMDTPTGPTATVLGKAQTIAPVNAGDHWYVYAAEALASLGIETQMRGPALFLKASDLRSLGFDVEGDAAGVEVTKP